MTGFKTFYKIDIEGIQSGIFFIKNFRKHTLSTREYVFFENVKIKSTKKYLPYLPRNRLCIRYIKYANYMTQYGYYKVKYKAHSISKETNLLSYVKQRQL